MTTTVALPDGNTLSTTAVSGGFSAQLLDPAGHALAPAFTMAVSGFGYYTLESVKVQADSGYVVDYSYDGPLLPGTEHFAAAFTAAGLAASEPVRLDQTAAVPAAPPHQTLAGASVAAAEVARLYDTTFGRLPDQAGETFWTHALESGAATPLQATQAFIGSAEFQATYGAVDDSHFVQLLFQNTLHRAPDGMGLAYWTTALETGQTRAQIVLDFSESAEHVALTAPHIDNGIWFV
jgi:hypothetical protein